MSEETAFARALREHPLATKDLPTIPPLSSLPVIIDGPGEYRTRAGHKVVIDGIRGHGTFAAKGSWFKFGKRPKNDPGEYCIWHVSGCYEAIRRDHPLDIVSKICP
jgi:hypothetical protein